MIANFHVTIYHGSDYHDNQYYHNILQYYMQSTGTKIMYIGVKCFTDAIKSKQ